MIRLGVAATALVAGALLTSFAIARDDDHAARGRPDATEFSAIHTQFCKDRYARQAGRMAYLEARLSLTPSQQPLFAAWKDAVLQTAQTRANTCISDTRPEKPENMLAREAREETRLEARLTALQAEKPALTALYQSLSDEQKRAFDHAGHHHEPGHEMWMRHGETGGDRDRHPGDRDI